MIRRIVRRETGNATPLSAALHPVLARVYAARGVQSAQEVDHSLARLAPPDRLHNIDAAAGLLQTALRERWRILILGDFDADGATSSALAVRALRAMGASDVHYLVPNRFEYGYGLTPEIVRVAAGLKPDLLITVDNGIASVDGVAAAHAAGMRVLITDHHLPGAALPDAEVIVNPNQPDDEFPSKALAGVGVIFYVMLALRGRLRRDGWFAGAGIDEPNLAQFLDLVALGTVADVVPLDHNNRVLVAQGLRRINQQQACPGILALLRIAGRAPGALSATDLGFAVAPRLNAAGRLTDMSLGIECLLTDDAGRAEQIARELDALNRERRAIESEMQAQAMTSVDALHLSESLPHGLCLFDESWHQGVIGILAARVRERVHRPVIAFAPAGSDEIKGSARSIPGFHIRDVLDAIATRHPGLLTKFGGHAMAAGLSLPRAAFDTFAAAFDAEARRLLDDSDLEGQVLSDGPLVAGEMTLDVAHHLRDAGPWGHHFPEPVFDDDFDVLSSRVVGEHHLKLQLRHASGRTLDAIAFRQAALAPAPGQRIRTAYRLDVNRYQGNESLQLVIEQILPA